MLDLVLRGARVIDPSQNIDAHLDVGFADGKVAALAAAIDTPAAETRDVSGCVVSPGFIDMHAHVYWGATSISIDGEQIARRGGVTTMVDAGSAGPANFPGLRRYIIDPSPRRILAYLNVAYPGIFAYSKPVMVGECADLRLIDPIECVRTVGQHRDVIVGIKVRIGRVASEANGSAALDMAFEVGDQTGLPVMVHVDHPPPQMRDVLRRLRKGDVLTHCFRPFPNTPQAPDGGIWQEVLEARERGVFFDLGHGASSFGFEVAGAMLDKGFLPDAISTDIHVLNVDGPVFDLATTMGKFLAMGAGLHDVISRVTAGPARGLNRPELGTLRPGAAGDATVYALEQGSFQFTDCFGRVLSGSLRVRPSGVVSHGRWLED
ncbi:amidohydrolase/deacetylase family metallohydrolase [Verticiella sediminum]|uniref:Amidohydrolase/deacetylase family metallohydrolase n=1 Tax=Verticiella sediminum TaxID=1247510 RepID=A0A556ACG0_9BURK|nr:amidohydrolase/deacetylase family metallohydrolase [Verticiella sediminum]TSH90574.1 amidohydrolase/deacetylase family metallohydrolase [Verticiella sediminum]